MPDMASLQLTCDEVKSLFANVCLSVGAARCLCLSGLHLLASPLQLTCRFSLMDSYREHKPCYSKRHQYQSLSSDGWARIPFDVRYWKSHFNQVLLGLCVPTGQLENENAGTEQKKTQ
ncbi:hypothetical protein XENTR_v10008385 [Xenopus tropicalis]|nr:hypothetical protein XENTR_v10008385 [Xenopus tropicalis]